MAAVPNCAKLHGTPAMTEEVVPGENGALQNVVVYLKGDFDAYSFATPQTRVRMDQKGCVYAPHVVALMIGQPLQVSNSDSVTHNVHAVARTNRDWNHSQAPGAAPLELIFDREEVAIPLVCNMHAFMRAYVAVLGNPYFRVTGADGSFSLRNVPPGTYTLSAWHELYGKNERNITVRAKEEASVTITFKAVPGGN
jgi:plastocyanin